jgi:hypothetical protein
LNQLFPSDLIQQVHLPELYSNCRACLT